MAKKRSEARRLKYCGKGEYITSPVPVPARDLEVVDLLELADAWSAVGIEMSADDVLALLTDGAPGRRTAEGKPLYQSGDAWVCEECGRSFGEWDAYHEHTLTHQEEKSEGESESWPTD